MSRWAVSRITDLPVVSDGEPDDRVWYPVQHALGIDTFGANVFVARRVDQQLVQEHDERESGQQELYLVLDGSAIFDLDGEEVHLHRGEVLAVTDPAIRRRARALRTGTMLLVVGSADGPFASTWKPEHFADIPRPS
jgi:quercetin dioxygenase-like cupin family protein